MTQVLVVDDSRATRASIKRILEAAGFSVVEAGNGIEALDQLESDAAVALVLADWNMPGMDGFELIKAIRAERKWASLPIMMVSAEVDQRQIARALMAGADEYVMKPFDRETLVAKLENIGFVLAERDAS